MLIGRRPRNLEKLAEKLTAARRASNGLGPAMLSMWPGDQVEMNSNLHHLEQVEGGQGVGRVTAFGMQHVHTDVYGF